MSVQISLNTEVQADMPMLAILSCPPESISQTQKSKDSRLNNINLAQNQIQRTQSKHWSLPENI